MSLPRGLVSDVDGLVLSTVHVVSLQRKAFAATGRIRLCGGRDQRKGVFMQGVGGYRINDTFGLEDPAHGPSHG